MNKVLILLGGILVLGAGCDSATDNTTRDPADSVQARINALEKRLYEGKAEKFDEEGALLLSNAYVDYQSARPEAEESADYLFKAGELTMQLGDYQRSLRYFSDVYDDYPNYANRPMALFYQATIYDDRVNADEKAKEVYEQFIKNHPDHPMKKDAEVLIKHLGKSNEELIKEFEAANSKSAQQ